jgi:hypothetical protein
MFLIKGSKRNGTISVTLLREMRNARVSVVVLFEFFYADLIFFF